MVQVTVVTEKGESREYSFVNEHCAQAFLSSLPKGWKALEGVA